MLDKFGFEEIAEDSRSEILVEFFDDDYEDPTTALENLMDVLRELKDKASHLSEGLLYEATETHPTSTFMCLTGKTVHQSRVPHPGP